MTDSSADSQHAYLIKGGGIYIPVCLVSRSQTTFFLLYWGGKKGSGELNSNFWFH